MTTTVSKNSRWRADRGRVKKDSENRIIDDKLARGPRGFVLCRYCQKETNNEYRTFCNPVCIHNFKLQTQPCYVRLKLFERDKGICMECGINAHGIFEGAASCSNLEIRLRYFGGLDDKWRLKVKKPLSDFTQHFTPGMFWEAAHIIGVYKGGGACSLDNYRTLCVPCHHKETKRENAERAALRKIEKQNLPKDQTFLHKYWNHKKIGASEPPKQVHDKDYSSLLPRTTESTSNLDNRLDENTPKPPPGLIIPQNKLNIKSSSTFKGVVHQVVSSGQLSGNSRSTVISGNISISGTQSVPDDAKRKKYWNEAVRTMLAYEEQEKGPNTDWDSIKLRYPDVFSPRRKASPSDAASLSEKKYIEIDLTLTPDEPAIITKYSQDGADFPTSRSTPKPTTKPQLVRCTAQPDKKVSTTEASPIASPCPKRRPFTAEEEQVLIDGVQKFGTNWVYIKSQHPELFATRTPVNLKDKARNLKKKGLLDY